jgi:very-short-patch-repair endonuclease
MYKHNPNLTPKARFLRKNMTPEERRLWYDFLRTYPVKFLRQKVIDNYIVDFYCPTAKLAIELDGSQHYQKRTAIKDRFRTEIISGYNISVLRIPNNEINDNFAEVCEYIDAVVTDMI